MSDREDPDTSPDEEPPLPPDDATEESDTPNAATTQRGNDTYHITGTLTDKEGELYEIDVTLDAPDEVAALATIEGDYVGATWITGPLVVSVTVEASIPTPAPLNQDDLLHLSNDQIATLKSVRGRLQYTRHKEQEAHFKALAKVREHAKAALELDAEIQRLNTMIPPEAVQGRLL